MAMSPMICAIHGAGGGAWEYERFWLPRFQAASLDMVAITLEPSAGGIERTTFTDYVQQVEAFIRGRCEHDPHRPIVLIGASMGAVIALKVAEMFKTTVCGIVLVCAVSPSNVRPSDDRALANESYPPVIRWANAPLQDTIDSMPDASPEVCTFAAERWRDESGAALITVLRGVDCARLLCPALVVIPGADETVSPDSQRRLAQYLSAETREYTGMSHVGPLLGAHADQVADDVIQWLRGALILS